MDDKNIFSQLLTDFFKAMGNGKRQEIVLNIFSDSREHNNSEVALKAKIAQSTASEHLSILKRAGILVSRKVEKEVFYQLDRQSILLTIEKVKTILNCCPDK